MRIVISKKPIKKSILEQRKLINAAIVRILNIEELPGPMPDALWLQISSGRESAANAFRVTVQQTKKEAVEQLLKLRP